MEFEGYLRFLLALIFVVALIGVLAALARRYGIGTAMGGKGSKNRRLGIVEVMALDSRRRLVLVRRDETEHLVLIGPTGDRVIERNVTASPSTFAQALDRSAATAGEDGP